MHVYYSTPLVIFDNTALLASWGSVIKISGFSFDFAYMSFDDNSRFEELVNLYTLAGGDVNDILGVILPNYVHTLACRRKLFIECAQLLGEL